MSAEGEARGKKLPHGHDKASATKQTQGDPQVQHGTDSNWQAQLPAAKPGETSHQPSSVDGSEAGAEAGTTDGPQAEAWRGDGEVWLSHLQASREQPAELSRITSYNVCYTKLLRDTKMGNGAVGIPGALSNQPPMDSNIPEQATGSNHQSQSSGSSRKEATRNFELDTTVSHIKRAAGNIRRLTVSLAVDYTAVKGEDGTVTRQPRSQEELETLRRLLKGGLGFDVSRGDHIEVVSVPFNRPDLEAVAEAPMYEQSWFCVITSYSIHYTKLYEVFVVFFH